MHNSGMFGNAWAILMTWLRAVWLFMLTFWPGYDGGRVEGLHREGEGDLQAWRPPPRIVRRVDTNAQRCREELNYELIDRDHPDRG